MKMRTLKISWWRRLFGGVEQVPVVVIRREVGKRMEDQEVARVMQANKDHPAVVAMMQILGDYSVNAEAMAKWDQRIQDGMSAHYLMAQSYLDDVVADIEDLRSGKAVVRRQKKVSKADEGD